MTPYILILVMSFAGGMNVNGMMTTAEFGSEEACRAAAVEMQKAQDRSVTFVLARCVPKS